MDPKPSKAAKHRNSPRNMTIDRNRSPNITHPVAVVYVWHVRVGVQPREPECTSRSRRTAGEGRNERDEDSLASASITAKE